MAGKPGSLLVHGGTVVPMTERGRAFSADVLVEDGVIVGLGQVEPPSGCATLDARGGIVLPGFVQTHVHVVQSLARGRAEGLALLDWLQTRVWPYEAALTAEEVSIAARLGIAELLSTGTTCALDMGTTRHHDGVFLAAAELGIRMTSGKCLMDSGNSVPEALLEDTDNALATAEELGGRWHGAAGGRLRYAVEPRFVLSCSERMTRESIDLARRNGWTLHTHASENVRETALVRELTGRGNVEYLAELGFAGEDVVIAHCVHLDDGEYDLLGSAMTGVAHCPGSNLKLASGIADLPRLLASGVRVGLGADGPPCNNRLSIFHELALAGTLHNLRHGEGAVDAWTALELATWRGAQAMGLGDEIGRIAAGYRADLVVLEPSLSMAPAAGAADMVVFGGDPTVVRHVVVDGVTVVRDRSLQTADSAAIAADAGGAAAMIAGRLGWT